MVLVSISTSLEFILLIFVFLHRSYGIFGIARSDITSDLCRILVNCDIAHLTVYSFNSMLELLRLVIMQTRVQLT